jgi:methylmalonyl-CoA mutase
LTQTPFPPRSEADWRQAAEAALKGAAFDKLVSVTADGIRLGPLHGARAGARALRGAPGPWKALARLDLPSPADFNAQAREDLDNGADGLAVVFAGSGAAYGFGLARADPAALHAAFEGVDFDAGSRFRLEIGEKAQAQAFAALVERSGADVARADIAFGLDPLGAELKTTAEDLQRRGFAGPFAAADGRAVHDAGGTPAQELAFALAAGLAALRGLEISPEFRLAADADEIATLAKFRAMRLLWGRVEEACGLKPAPIRLAASSAWRMMTVAEPYVNVMRATLAAFAAGLGGADDVALLPFTQAIGLPDAFARRLARNAQLIELREARLGAVADPAAGAGAFEALTDGFCEKAWTQFQAIEAGGGLAKALEQGLVQHAVAESAAALKRDVARAKTPLTGMSAHPHLNAEPIAVLPDVAAPLAAGPLQPLRLSEPFERLRARAERLAPSVFLAAIGPLSAHTRRVGFARETFEAGGVRAITGGVEAFRARGAAMACLCGTDEAYAEHAESCAAALKAAGASAVYLAGRPGEREAAWRAAGVDGFLYAGMDMVAALDEVLRRAGS